MKSVLSKDLLRKTTWICTRYGKILAVKAFIKTDNQSITIKQTWLLFAWAEARLILNLTAAFGVYAVTALLNKADGNYGCYVTTIQTYKL